MTISREDVPKIADLIKIQIPESDYESYQQQLNTVLGAVEVLKEAETADVATTSQTHGLKNVLREDIPEASLDMKAYPNRQNFDGNYFVVKGVFDEE